MRRVGGITSEDAGNFAEAERLYRVLKKSRQANYTANFSKCLRPPRACGEPAGAIFCGRKATLIEIRQLSLTAACKARQGLIGATKVADRSEKSNLDLPPSHRAIRSQGGRGNPVALSSG
jgi:hypothetical protein